MTEQEDSAEASVPDRPRRASHDSTPPQALLEFMVHGWHQADQEDLGAIAGAPELSRRRQQLSERFAGQLVVIPSGREKVRSNDTTYRYRPGTDFLYLVGEGEPDDVLVLEPAPEGGHHISVYAEPEADFSKPDFFTDRVKGVFWVGPRRSLGQTAGRLGLAARPVQELPGVMSRYHQGAVLRGLDPQVDHLAADIAGADAELATFLSEMRLVKDQLEVEFLQQACDLTTRAFEDVVRQLPGCRSERDVEAVFFRRARTEGYDTGYPTIAAAGGHATVLHWSKNTGPVRPGELLLLDAGVETERFYTADVTRTLPISGKFSPEQRRVYDLVFAAQRAAIAEVRPGSEFLAPHRAAMRVLAEGLAELGVLPVSAEESLQPESQLHQRYTLHGVSHMLGLDVHDCAHARDENYRHTVLEPGMVLTVEPGLYFQENDDTVPRHLRGIGVRIDDDVLVTEDGCRVLSAALPRSAEEVERWMAQLMSSARR